MCGDTECFEWIYTLIICANCRALLNETPFGVKLQMKDADASKDAADRYPEILKWWDRMHELTDEEIRQYGFM